MNASLKVIFCFISLVLVTVFLSCINSSRSSELKNLDAFNSQAVGNQKKPSLSEDDKTQIIVEILKQESLRDAKDQKKNAQNIIYIDSLLPIKQFPQIESIKVQLFVPAFMKAQKDSEIVFYQFSDFQFEDSKVVLPVIWNKRDSSSGHQAIIEYSCQKTSGKWIVEGKTVSISVSESH